MNNAYILYSTMAFCFLNVSLNSLASQKNFQKTQRPQPIDLMLSITSFGRSEKQVMDDLEFSMQNDQNLLNKDKNGKTLLHNAFKFHYLSIAQRLIQLEPILVFQKDNEGDTPLSYAIKEKNVPAVELLVKNKALIKNNEVLLELVINQAKKRDRRGKRGLASCELTMDMLNVIVPKVPQESRQAVLAKVNLTIKNEMSEKAAKRNNFVNIKELLETSINNNAGIKKSSQSKQKRTTVAKKRKKR